MRVTLRSRDGIRDTGVGIRGLASHGRLLAAFVSLALALIAGGCASSGAVPQPFPRPSPRSPDVPAAPPLGPGLGGFSIAGAALALQGVPYRSGGADPSGFDCSGFVQYVLGQAGVAWPRIVRAQFEAGQAVAPDHIQPGDMVFFVTEGHDVSHVGIAIGGDRFVHAPNSGGVVRIDWLGAEYWNRRFAGARRAVFQ
jgi:hypothetical protein